MATATISGSLLDSIDAGLRLNAQVELEPISTSGFIVEGGAARAGHHPYDVPAGGTLSKTVTKGIWKVTVRPLGKVGDRPAFNPVSVTTDIQADTTWGAIIGAETSNIPVTPSAVSEANAARDAAEVAAGLADQDALAAEDSATAAAGSATSAGTSATSATSSKNAAATSETNAAGSASSAGTSRDQAAGSASSAGTSRTLLNKGVSVEACVSGVELLVHAGTSA